MKRRTERPRTLAAGTLAIAFACGGKAEPIEKCGPDCARECEGSLPEGLLGSHLGAADASDGRFFVSAYVDHARTSGNDVPYGDVALGTFDPKTAALRWQVIAGVGEPIGSCGEKASTTFRGGRLETGDDVGLYSQVVTLVGDEPFVTYYDVTNRALRAAVREGSTFVSHAVTAPDLTTVSAGRYARLTLFKNRPVIAYVSVEGTGVGTARVVVSQAATERPVATGDWAAVELGKAQVAGVANMDPTAPEVALGAGLAIASRGECLAVAYYDTQTAKVVVHRRRGEAWNSTEASSPIGAAYGEMPGTLTAIAVDDACTAHIAYRVAIASPLYFRQGNVDGTFTTEELIDDGATDIDGQRQPDGAHLLADAALKLRGEDILVAYQDVSRGRLRIAKRHASTWSRYEAAAVTERADGAFPSFTTEGVVSFNRLRVAGTAQGSVTHRTLFSFGL